MLNNAPKQNLAGDAIGNADRETPATERNFWAIAVIALALLATADLAGHLSNDREVAVTAAADRHLAAVDLDLSAPMIQHPADVTQANRKERPQAGAGKQEADGNVQDLTY